MKVTPVEASAIRDWPAYWLVDLETAVRQGDYRRASHAQSELKRLGLEVTIKPSIGPAASLLEAAR